MLLYVIWPIAIYCALGLPLEVTVYWDMELSNIADLSTKPHGVISQTIVNFMPTIGRISHHLIHFLSVFGFCMRELRNIYRHEREGVSGGLGAGNWLARGL
jgi:hypothetical protein